MAGNDTTMELLSRSDIRSKPNSPKAPLNFSMYSKVVHEPAIIETVSTPRADIRYFDLKG